MVEMPLHLDLALLTFHNCAADDHVLARRQIPKTGVALAETDPSLGELIK